MKPISEYTTEELLDELQRRVADEPPPRCSVCGALWCAPWRHDEAEMT